MWPACPIHHHTAGSAADLQLARIPRHLQLAGRQDLLSRFCLRAHVRADGGPGAAVEGLY